MLHEEPLSPERQGGCGCSQKSDSHLKQPLTLVLPDLIERANHPETSVPTISIGSWHSHHDSHHRQPYAFSPFPQVRGVSVSLLN